MLLLLSPRVQCSFSIRKQKKKMMIIFIMLIVREIEKNDMTGGR